MFCCLTCLCENEGGVHPTFRSRRSRPSLTRQAMGGVAGFSAVRIDRAPFPAFSPGTTSRASFKPHLSWVNELPFVGIPTVRSLPCWRVLDSACRKQSISVSRTSPQMVWVIRCSKFARAVSFPFTTPPRLPWNDTSSGGLPIPHWTVTYSFPWGGARYFCTTPKPPSTMWSNRSAFLADLDSHDSFLEAHVRSEGAGNLPRWRGSNHQTYVGAVGLPWP